MTKRKGRKPVGNFFVKKRLQMDVIVRVAIAMVISTIVASAMIVVVYVMQHRSILLYQLTEAGDLAKENILSLILPSLGMSVAVNIVIGVFLGMYASRKYAVPVYKLEQWAKGLNAGDLRTTLQFREHKHLGEFAETFNTLSSGMRNRLEEVQKLLDSLSPELRDSDQAKKVAQFLSNMQLGIKEEA